MRGSPAGTDAGGTRHGRRPGASSEHPPTRPAAQLSVGLKNAAALSKAQKHRTSRSGSDNCLIVLAQLPTLSQDVARKK